MRHASRHENRTARDCARTAGHARCGQDGDTAGNAQSAREPIRRNGRGPPRCGAAPGPHARNRPLLISMLVAGCGPAVNAAASALSQGTSPTAAAPAAARRSPPARTLLRQLMHGGSRLTTVGWSKHRPQSALRGRYDRWRSNRAVLHPGLRWRSRMHASVRRRCCCGHQGPISCLRFTALPTGRV